jgi:hypothetical protein
MSKETYLKCSYIHLKEAWYKESVFPAYKGMLDEIQITIETEENVEHYIHGEMSFRFMQINEETQAWEFRMFDDGFKAFHCMAPELTEVIGNVHNHTTAEEIIEMLKIFNFKDETPKINPHAR